jgi:hypothetical protein
MINFLKIGAILVLAALYSSPSMSAPAAKNVKCNGCVGTKDIKNNAVTGAKIKNGSVGMKDLGLE